MKLEHRSQFYHIDWPTKNWWLLTLYSVLIYNRTRLYTVLDQNQEMCFAEYTVIQHKENIYLANKFI